MKKVVLILVLMQLFGCDLGSSGDEGIIDEVKMAQVIADIIVHERLVASQQLPIDSALKIYQEKYRPQIEENYHLSEEQLQASMEYYLNNTDKLNHVMDIVIDSLERREAARVFY